MTGTSDVDDVDSHGQPGGCPGMWRITGTVLDPETGALTEYRCELCTAALAVPPGGLHPTTV